MAQGVLIVERRIMGNAEWWGSSSPVWRSSVPASRATVEGGTKVTALDLAAAEPTHARDQSARR
jgi:hypothetical protein